jgi:adenosylcobinamide-phosphate synthase
VVTVLVRSGRSVIGRRLAGAAAGLILDRSLGELPIDPHPVAAFGTTMTAVERRIWNDDRGAGVGYATIGLAMGVLTGVLVGSTAAATYVSSAGRMLRDTAMSISDALARGDLAGARRGLPSLVGRDATQLEQPEIVRAVVESVAENTVDAVVAPACWAAIGGAPAVLAHRATNTMDAMVGHRSTRYENFGWASARLDDVLNWLPARVTAALVIAARPSTARDVRAVVARDARAHPSPNAGVAEAAFAAALGVRLGGRNRYGERVEDRAMLGHGRPPEVHDIARAVDLSDDVARVLVTVLVAASTAFSLTGGRT